MLFITLLLPKGKTETAIKYLKEIKPPKNITIQQLYFTFGRYDGIIIFEAPSEAAAMNFVMKTKLAMHYTIQTLIAVPTNEVTAFSQ